MSSSKKRPPSRSPDKSIRGYNSLSQNTDSPILSPTATSGVSSEEIIKRSRLCLDTDGDREKNSLPPNPSECARKSAPEAEGESEDGEQDETSLPHTPFSEFAGTSNRSWKELEIKKGDSDFLRKFKTSAMKRRQNPDYVDSSSESSLETHYLERNLSPAQQEDDLSMRLDQNLVISFHPSPVRSHLSTPTVGGASVVDLTSPSTPPPISRASANFFDLPSTVDTEIQQFVADAYGTDSRRIPLSARRNLEREFDQMDEGEETRSLLEPEIYQIDEVDEYSADLPPPPQASGQSSQQRPAEHQPEEHPRSSTSRYPPGGTGFNFPTDTPTDKCRISADGDWLYCCSREPSHILQRIKGPRVSWECTFHAPLQRTWNNKSSRLAVRSKTGHFKPTTRFSSRSNSYPYPLTLFPNIVVARIRVHRFTFTISLYLLVDNIRPSNYMTEEEVAVLCTAFEAVRKHHAEILLDCGITGQELQFLETAANAMTKSYVGKKEDKRNNTTVDGHVGFYILFSIRYVLKLLKSNGNHFLSLGLAARLNGVPIAALRVQEIASEFLSKSLWEASCAGCKHIWHLTDFREIQLSNKERMREYIARCLSLLQQHLDQLVEFESETPHHVTFAVDLGIVLKPLTAGTSFVLNGVEAAAFAAPLLRRNPDGESDDPSGFPNYFEESWRTMSEALHMFPPVPFDNSPNIGRFGDDGMALIRENHHSVAEMVEFLEQWFRFKLSYEFDGQTGEPKIAGRWRKWTDADCREDIPNFYADQLSSHDELQYHPCIEDFDDLCLDDPPTQEEEDILHNYQSVMEQEFPYGVGGLRYMRHYQLPSQGLPRPAYIGQSIKGDHYRRRIWQPVVIPEAVENSLEMELDTSDEDDASGVEATAVRDLSAEELEELEAAMIEEENHQGGPSADGTYLGIYDF